MAHMSTLVAIICYAVIALNLYLAVTPPHALWWINALYVIALIAIEVRQWRRFGPRKPWMNTRTRRARVLSELFPLVRAGVMTPTAAMRDYKKQVGGDYMLGAFSDVGRNSYVDILFIAALSGELERAFAEAEREGEEWRL